MFKKIESFVFKTSTYITASTIAAGVALAFINVVARYVFNASLTWASELTTYLFIWSTFFGAVYCFKKSEHISITLLIDKAGIRWVKPLFISSLVVSIVYMGAISFFGYDYLLLVNDLEETSVDLGVQMWLVYLVVPVSFACSVYILVIRFFETLKTPSAELKINNEVKSLLDEIIQEEKDKKEQEKAQLKAGDEL